MKFSVGQEQWIRVWDCTSHDSNQGFTTVLSLRTFFNSSKLSFSSDIPTLFVGYLKTLEAFLVNL